MRCKQSEVDLDLDKNQERVIWDAGELSPEGSAPSPLQLCEGAWETAERTRWEATLKVNDRDASIIKQLHLTTDLVK